MVSFYNNLAHVPAQLGVLSFSIPVGATNDDQFEKEIETLGSRRAAPLSDFEESRRKDVRNMLRFNKFKPTGRSKPASEFLLAAIRKEPHRLTRILPTVDIANYISLKYLLPVSIWDVDRASTRAFVFREGLEGESYAFNASQQRIDLRDLLVGCAAQGAADERGRPVVNPIKDSQATKMSGETRNGAACIYVPLEYEREAVEAPCREFEDFLRDSMRCEEVDFDVIRPGEAVAL